MSTTTDAPRRLTVVDIAQQYADGERLAMLTAYDFPTAKLLDEAGIPLLLVGDSLGQVILGYETTVRVTMDEMLHHTKAVVRGSERALVDRRHAVPLVCDPGRGARERRDLPARGRRPGRQGRRRRPHRAGHRDARPCRHPGHGPHRPDAAVDQHHRQVTRSRARTATPARALLADAQAVQEAGAFSMVVELVPEQLAAAITERLRVPTIGIGAGAGCSGQVQVITDLIGLGDFVPRHARPVRQRPRGDPRGGTGLRSGRRRGHVPGSRRDRPDGRGGPRRGPRARLAGPAGRVGAGRRHPARPRPLSADAPPTFLPGSPDGRHVTRVLRTRAELQAALASAPRPVGLVPTMGWLHDGHRALMQRARRDDATTVVTIFVNPRQFNEAADYQRYPRNEARDLAICEAEERRLRLGSTGRGGLPARLRYRRPGRRPRPTAGGRRAARPLRRRGDRGGHPVRRRRRGARLLRPEGRAAGDGHPPDGPRPRHRDRGHRLSHRPRTGWPGALVAQRPSRPGAAHRGARCSAGRCAPRGRAWDAGERSGDALRDGDASRARRRAAGRCRVRVGRGRGDA